MKPASRQSWKRKVQMGRLLFTFPRVNRGKHENELMVGQSTNRFTEVALYRSRPLLPHLSGLKLEFVVLQIYWKEKGPREIEIGFNVGQGSQDIGFRNTIPILFDVAKAVKINLEVRDEDNSSSIASVVISDGIEHVTEDSVRLEHIFESVCWELTRLSPLLGHGGKWNAVSTDQASQNSAKTEGTVSIAIEACGFAGCLSGFFLSATGL